jgi:beta-lactamase class C
MFRKVRPTLLNIPDENYAQTARQATFLIINSPKTSLPLPVMKITTLFVALMGVVTTLTTPSCTQAPASPPAPRPAPVVATTDPVLQAFLDNYDQYFDNGMRESQTPGAGVVIVKDGKVVFMRGYGVKVTGTRDSVDAGTVFRVGSLSKGFAGVLTGILVQRGILNWNERVQDRFPEFSLRDKAQAGRMEIRHILSHTTGLPYHAYTNLVERGYDLRTIVRNYFPGAPIVGKEGAYYSYQNAAYCVIEEVMRAATGQSYQDLLLENILRPAGMVRASCDYESMHHCADKALPHFQTRAGEWRADSITERYYNFAAAGGVNASVQDMGEWLKVLLGYRPDIVADSTLDYVFTPVIKTDKERRLFPHWINREDASYAIGWRVLNVGDRTIIYHGGYVNGFKCEIAFDRKEKIGICALFNAHTPFCNQCIPAFFK